jgi:hypothetical protein
MGSIKWGGYSVCSKCDTIHLEERGRSHLVRQYLYFDIIFSGFAASYHHCHIEVGEYFSSFIHTKESEKKMQLDQTRKNFFEVSLPSLRQYRVRVLNSHLIYASFSSFEEE